MFLLISLTGFRWSLPSQDCCGPEKASASPPSEGKVLAQELSCEVVELLLSV